MEEERSGSHSAEWRRALLPPPASTVTRLQPIGSKPPLLPKSNSLTHLVHQKRFLKSNSSVSQRIQFFDNIRENSMNGDSLLTPNSANVSELSSSPSVDSFENDSASPSSTLERSSTIKNESDESDAFSYSEDEEEISNRKNKIFNVAKEIMTSESEFVGILRFIHIHFREYILEHIQKDSSILPLKDFDKIYSNIPELLCLNEDLLGDFEIRIANWSTSSKIADVLVKKGQFLLLYATYIKDFTATTAHYREIISKYPIFGKLVKDFESMEECKNLKIDHYLLKPVQRLPQYKLLLQQYLKYLSESDEDYNNAVNALRIVSDAAAHANDSLKQSDNFKRMLSLQNRLNESDLIRPDRDLLKEGELSKISRSSVDPRYIILLTDCLLITTYSRIIGDVNHLYIRYKIPLDQLQVSFKDDSLDDEIGDFQIISPIRSCTFRSLSLEERNEWVTSLESAIKLLLQKRSTFSDVILTTKMNVLGETAPIWIPDRKVTMCHKCTVDFTVLVRRHHCRGCGIVVCFHCSSNRAPLKYMDNKAERVCDDCFISLKEVYYFEDMKTNTDILSRFKKREIPKTMGRVIPNRLKVSANVEGAKISGLLRKYYPKSGKWKKYFFVLNDRVLYVYKASGDTAAIETYPVLGYSVQVLSPTELKEFEISMEESNCIFQLLHKDLERLSMVYRADNESLANRWICALITAVTLD